MDCSSSLSEYSASWSMKVDGDKTDDDNDDSDDDSDDLLTWTVMLLYSGTR